MKTQSAELSIPTRFGRFSARYSGKGLVRLNFPSGGRASSFHCRRRGNESQISSASSAAVRDSSRRLLQIPAKILRWHHAATVALKSVLVGRKPKNVPPLDLSGGTPFQQNVWRALQKISRGKTRSYGEIARAIGKPKAVRAVGGACGANPIPIFVPCHRVLAADGKPGGFSAGLNWKRKLLAREGVVLR